MEEYLEGIREGYMMVKLDLYQSNHEGDLIDYLHANGFEKHTGIVINAGAYSHTSIALRDAILSIEAPVVEVHITDIHQRDPFRSTSYLTDVSRESFIGKGMEGYRMAIDFLLGMISENGE